MKKRSELKPRHPVYVISKGRHDCCLTARFLARDDVPFRLVVEPQECDLYAKAGFEKQLLVTPFSNLGLGSIPARNFVWEHAKTSGAERHWILDDNIRNMWRRWKAQRIPCDANIALRVVEDFAGRYENVAIAGHNYCMFLPDKRKFSPFFLNVHVYSSLLILNSLEMRWRGRYNEDTDLCLQALSAGWCTVLFNAFMVEKMPTMTMKGGNATELYTGDGRLKMARSLERVWPGVVETKRRFQRPQHVVKNAWKSFDTPLKRRADVDFSKLPPIDDYGMRLKQVKETKSESLRRMVENERERQAG